ncbi:hypothetical protein SK128_007787 [Halocaridina rubra]|uniref:Uncharacterized protein n=1 Tax=Halocaridina rubra TaxID=373956 RepID=A0AAN9A0H0_HALRR
MGHNPPAEEPGTIPHKEEKPEITFSENSLWGNFKTTLKSIQKNVTLEPMLFLKMVAESNYAVVGDTLEIQRVCLVNLNYSAEDCNDMDDGNHTDIQVSTYSRQVCSTTRLLTSA